jgi:hypothetical protein
MRYSGIQDHGEHGCLGEKNAQTKMTLQQEAFANPLLFMRIGLGAHHFMGS